MTNDLLCLYPRNMGVSPMLATDISRQIAELCGNPQTHTARMAETAMLRTRVETEHE